MAKFIISGGGTGGHIFPAIAIANAIKEHDPNAQILFVGAIGKMEMEKVPLAGYKIEGIHIVGIQRKSILKNIFLPITFFKSLLQAHKIISNFKPNAAIGVGGYASGPLLLMAQFKKIKTFIQEQNSYPGITNKWLSKKVDKIYVAYPGLEKYFDSKKIILTGNPVRKDIYQVSENKEQAANFFKLNATQKTLFITGGSLGALSVNKAIAKALPLFKEHNIQLIWQTGKTFFAEAKQALENIKYENVVCVEFLKEMNLAYSIATIVISRAGAGAISELAIAGKASVFIPLPSAAEDHQTKNARVLVQKNAALLIKDSEALETLGIKTIQLFNDSKLCDELQQNILKFAEKNAAEKITQSIYSQLNLNV
jgi:UDP-N-acetylglucosamine--N-acetylmuramyl-(pentapeptide) pyrophosphoryl-undecaprenol N-acetylglucosamine transferase